MKGFLSILRRFLPPYRKFVVLNVVFSILTAIFGSFSFFVIMPILNILFEKEEPVLQMPNFTFNMEYVKGVLGYYFTGLKDSIGVENSLLVAGGAYVLMTLLKVGTAYFGELSMIHIRNNVVCDIRNQLYNKVLALPLAFFSEERKGDVMARITGDVVEVENSVMNSLNLLFRNPIQIIVFLAVMIFMSWRLTIFVLILLPISGFIIGKVGKSLKKQSRDGQDKMGDLLSITEETLSGHRIIKAFNAEEKMSEHFAKENDKYKNIVTRLLGRYVLAHPMSELLGAITIIILLWYGGRLILPLEKVWQRWIELMEFY